MKKLFAFCLLFSVALPTFAVVHTTVNTQLINRAGGGADQERDISATIPQGGSYTANTETVSGTDLNENAGSSSAGITFLPSAGTVSFDDVTHTVTYTPTSDFSGTGTFSVQEEETGSGDIWDFAFTIEVTPTTPLVSTDNDSDTLQNAGYAVAAMVIAGFLKNRISSDRFSAFAIPLEDAKFAYILDAKPTDNTGIRFTLTDRSRAESPESPLYNLRFTYNW